ncbi:MAG TPA: CRISPR-associated protein Csx11 [Anaerolineae bacterium]|nr:CRISPR-associated protein Csx11 [Anaerolineae bacterium]
MSNLPSLQPLVDNNNREALLLAEVAALLHDVGKLNDAHIKHVSGQNQWANDDGYKVVVDNPQQVVRLSHVAANIRKPDIVNNVLNARSPKAADFLPTALKESLETLRVSVLNQDYSLAELIMLGMPGFAIHQSRSQLLDGKDGWLPALLGVCHSVAHVDKEDPIGGVQPLPDVLTSNAFGYEQQAFVLGDPQKSLDTRLSTLAIDSSNLAATRKKILETLEYGLGDTRRPTNEVSLADWSAIVASLFKTALAGAVFTGTQPNIRGWLSWKDKIIDHDFHWRLLRVNFDVLGLYAKAVKIADLLGYQRAVEQACEAVKKLVEEEYPLGNEVYRDTTGIYFTFPDLDLPADLAQEIRRRIETIEPELAPRIAVTVGDGQTATEQLKGILAKARREALEALAQPFDSQNLSTCWQQQWETVGDGRWEICPVCRLRPMEEGREACEHCEQRRQSRIAEWKQNPQKTIWMDELADANGRVALIVGKFRLEDWLSGDLVQTMLVKADPASNAFVPKNPSPARLRRVWETCRRFWAETVEQEILARHDYSKGDAVRCARRLVIPDRKTGWKENVPYDGVVNGKAISLLWQAQGQYFVTISNLQGVGELQRGAEIAVTEPDDPSRKITFTVQGVMVPGDMGAYAPYLPLLASPDQFLALVPAADALEIAEKIRGEYEKQFGKVQNRLPLFLGVVFFPRKTPLLAVIETGRRMAKGEYANDEWQIAKPPQNDGQKVTLDLACKGQHITLQVPIVMGDGTTEDVWYPYFEFVGTLAAHHTHCFERDGVWWVHVKTLQAGEAVRVTPSRFAYLWLDHTARRFAFDPAQDVLLLEELPRLVKMWEDLQKSGITETGLHGVWALLESKRESWETGQEFENLVRTTLKEAGLFDRRDAQNNPHVVTPEDVLSGRFFHCLELYLHILKQKIKSSKED